MKLYGRDFLKLLDYSPEEICQFFLAAAPFPGNTEGR